MHNYLQKDAQRYFLYAAKPNIETCCKAANHPEKKYSSVGRQTQLKYHLTELRDEKFVKNNVDTVAALANV